MKNLLSSWFRNLTAFDNGPVKQEFSIVDPTAAQVDGLNTVVLAVDPSDGNSPTMVSLYFDGSGVKLFEKKYPDDQDAQTEMSAMAKDLQEAATLSKEGKMDEAKKLAESLFEKYKRLSDPLSNAQPTPTMTQASQNNLEYKGFQLTQEGDGNWNAILTDRIAVRAESVSSVKAKIDNIFNKVVGKTLKKDAAIILQNVFFDTPDEAMEYQEKMKSLQGPEGSEEGKPLWEQMGGEEQVAPSNETSPDEDTELAPPSLSFDRIEKDKAKSDKDIGKRIKEQVKTEVESALEQKSASVFGPDQEDLVEALRKNGRNWDEIKKIFVKELSYNEDDTTVFLDSIRQKEEGGSPEGLPLPPKPPEDLVSPETHDKLVKEIEDKKEPEHNFITRDELKSFSPKPLEDEIARADNAEIRKVADLQSFNKWMLEKGLSGQDIPGDAWGIASSEAMKNPEYKKLYEQREQMGKGNILGNNSPEYKALNDKVVEMWVPYFEQAVYKLMGTKQASLKKKALNPLQEPPVIGQTPGQDLSSPVEENPTFDAPVPESQDSNPDPEFLEAPQAGDRVYVMGDYETGEDGYEGTMVSDYTSKGDEYAVISKDDGENAEVALHRVVRAYQKKVAKAYYEKKATSEKCNCGHAHSGDVCDDCKCSIFNNTKKAGGSGFFRTEPPDNRPTNQECSSCETRFAKPYLLDMCPNCKGKGTIKYDTDVKKKEADLGKRAESDRPCKADDLFLTSHGLECGNCGAIGKNEVKHKKANLSKKAEPYQGYTNFSTWGLSLWLDNERPLYDLSRALAQEIKDPNVLAKNLQSNFNGLLEEKGEEGKSSSEVDWLEIANDLLNEAKENEAYEKSQSAETAIESLPTMDVEKEKDTLLDQLAKETDPEKKKSLEQKYKRLSMADVDPELQSLHESALKIKAELFKFSEEGDGSLLAIYKLDKMVTDYNETTQDWSGKTRDFGFIDKGEIHVNSMEEALAKVKEIYGMDFEPFDESGRFSTNQIENADGYADPNGKYLADYSVYIKLYKEHKASKKAELERKGEIAIYFHKEGLDKQASGDSAFEGNGWCRVWIQEDEIAVDAKYPTILKLPDENQRIIALKDLARDLAHQALRDADRVSGKFGVQSWFEVLKPSDHDRIDWVALANPISDEEKAWQEGQKSHFSAQESKVEKKADVDHQHNWGRLVDPKNPDGDAYCVECNMKKSEFEKYASLKQAADPVPSAEGPKEVPTTLKQWQKAPKNTDKEKALPATMEQAQLVKDVESSLSSLEAIKSLVTQAKAKLAEEVRAIEEKGGRIQIEGEVKEKVERLSKLVEATQNQMIAAGDTLVRLVQETKDHPFKPSDKWKIEKLTERLQKYEDAAAFLKKAEDGAQHLATSEDTRELYFFPRKLSRLHKSAGFLDTLDAVYNDVLEALKLILGNESKEEPVAV